MTRVLFICTGNICRSPMAEGVFRHRVGTAGLSTRFGADSAGTHDYHVGEPPDPRAQQAAARRGYDISGIRARQFVRRDFSVFDYVLAMDRTHLRALTRLCPPEHVRKIRLCLEFARGLAVEEVPDPYGGADQDFESVLDLIEAATGGLIEHLRGRGAGEEAGS